MLNDFHAENIKLELIEKDLLEDKIDLNKQIEKAEKKKVW